MHTHNCDHCATPFSCNCEMPLDEGGDCGVCPILPEEEFGNILMPESSN